MLNVATIFDPFSTLCSYKVLPFLHGTCPLKHGTCPLIKMYIPKGIVVEFKKNCKGIKIEILLSIIKIPQSVLNFQMLILK